MVVLGLILLLIGLLAGVSVATTIGLVLILVGLVLNFVPDLPAALAEAQRVVRPAGIVAGYVWDYASGMQLLRAFFDAAIALDPAMAEHDEGVRFPITHEGRLAVAFAAAGLADVRQRPIDVPTVFRDFDDLWSPFLRGTGPAPAYVASLDEPARTALRERLRASLPIEPEPDGSAYFAATIIVGANALQPAIDHLRAAGGDGMSVVPVRYLFDDRSQHFARVLAELGK